MTARVYRAEDPRRTTHHTGCARRDARIAALETALRGVIDAHGGGRWCPRCGVTWGTRHTAACVVGRALRVLDGGAR